MLALDFHCHPFQKEGSASSHTTSVLREGWPRRTQASLWTGDAETPARQGPALGDQTPCATRVLCALLPGHSQEKPPPSEFFSF